MRSSYPSQGSENQDRFKEEVLARTDLAALVGERVKLKPAGQTLTGCCPFHDEKTPSFHVYNRDSSPHYHCYGCHAHGDALDFIQELDQVNFPEALKRLASRLGMEVPERNAISPTEMRTRRLFDMMSRVSELYRSQLARSNTGAVAREYLSRRGVSAEMTERFALGCTPPDRYFLERWAQTEQLEDLKALRLLSTREDGSLYDLFTNRLMFPIRDGRGRTVGFGGRTLADDRRKYINSPETPLFRKSEHLYGLWEARQHSRAIDQLIVVEGYLDVVALHQHGFTNAVAMLGTATNETSMLNLLNTCGDIVFCFDGDRAGRDAADKALDRLLDLMQPGTTARFLLLDANEDPDSLLRSKGAEAFRLRLEGARPLSEYLFDMLGRGLDLSVMESRLALRERALKRISSISDPKIKRALTSLAWDRTQAPRRSFTGRRAIASTPLTNSNESRRSSQEDITPRTLRLIALYILLEPSRAEKVRQLLRSGTSTSGEQEDTKRVTEIEMTGKTSATTTGLALLSRFAAYAEYSQGENYAALWDRLMRDQDARSQFAPLFPEAPLVNDLKQMTLEAEDALRSLAREELDRKLSALNVRLSRSPGNEQLTTELTTLIRQKRQLLEAAQNPQQRTSAETTTPPEAPGA